ncbi:peroxiredoxin [Gymnodinialimonas ceratoperidinii]|uniref:thioredoxin-dependent peroxiredoxin n=1 Tax=Gymnodinialimonas ceratoperidinii TaxID=2856823 RepID=A0A8F6YBT6_9RHOB|nr:peroxiredoxin [Gymnodinialimonas ceratoperidinii]QXT38545.1 peroxiredoxin [Gymnodinialimonas ceratoperidinii]
MLETGQPAPDFTLPRDGGGTLTLSEQQPKAVVLFFYPKDDTPGCTKEAIAFTGLESAFAEANTTIIGISKDTAAKHDKFAAKHALSVALVSDAEGDTCERYGTWVEKNMYGRKFMGIERTTFLIDGEGKIAQIWRKVKVPGHADDVLEAARAL